MKVTPCECDQPGWCPRHQYLKPPLLFELCRRVPDCFRRWEQGERPTAAAPKPQDDFLRCMHRREVVRTTECASCKGRVQIKVFSCAVHGECVIAAEIPGVPCCSACSDVLIENQFAN